MAMTPTEEIMMMGQRADVPMGNPQAPAPQAPAPQDPMAALMGNEMSLGEGGVERPMPEEAGMSIEQDAGDLVEAIVGRVEGNIEAAVAILDTAKAMLIAGEQEQQQMPIMAADGRYLSDLDSQTGRRLTAAEVLAGERTLSDVDLREVIKSLASSQIQEGKTLSDKDLQFFLSMLSQEGRTLSDKDLAPKTQSGRRMMMKKGGKIPKYAGGGLMSAEEARRKLNEYRS